MRLTMKAGKSSETAICLPSLATNCLVDSLERRLTLLVGDALAGDLAGEIAADGGKPFGDALGIEIVKQHMQAGERAHMSDAVAHLTGADHANLADGMGDAAMVAARLR